MHGDQGVDASLRLTRKERVALDRILHRLKEGGLQMSDEGFVLALLRAATQLPESALVKLIREGLAQDGQR